MPKRDAERPPSPEPGPPMRAPSPGPTPLLRPDPTPPPEPGPFDGMRAFEKGSPQVTRFAVDGASTVFSTAGSTSSEYSRMAIIGGEKGLGDCFGARPRLVGDGEPS